MPSALIQFVDVDRDRVAIITRGETPYLLLWDLKTRVTRSVRIKERPLIVGFHPGEDRLSILFLEVSDDMSFPPKIVRVRYSLAGKTISPLEEPPTSLALPRRYQESRIYGFWKSRPGITETAAVLLLPSDYDNPPPDLLFYYPETDEMSLRLSSQYPRIATRYSMLMTSDGVMCVVNKSGRGLQIWICDPDSPTPCRTLKLQSQLWKGFSPNYCVFYSDGDIFAILDCFGIEVWSCDPDLDMHDGQRLWSPSRGRSKE